MNKHAEPIIQIWPYSQVPPSLKRLSGTESEWVALIPPNLAWPELEALFLRWDGDSHRVIRHTLPDGSILFSGHLHK